MDKTEPTGFQILVVDDEALMRESLTRLLKAEGHRVHCAGDGREGLNLFENGKFDLVVLDYEMPDMKGDELALIIKALAPQQPLIMMSAFPETLKSNLLTDVDRVIGKPFDSKEFLKIATELLK